LFPTLVNNLVILSFGIFFLVFPFTLKSGYWVLKCMAIFMGIPFCFVLLFFGERNKWTFKRGKTELEQQRLKFNKVLKSETKVFDALYVTNTQTSGNIFYSVSPTKNGKVLTSVGWWMISPKKAQRLKKLLEDNINL